MSARARLGAAALAGALSALAFASPALAWIAWVALVPLFVGLDGASRRLTVGAAIVYSLALGFGAVEPWLAPASGAYFEAGPGRVAAYTAAALAVLCIAHGLVLGVLLLGRPGRGPWDVVWCGAAWVCWEALGTLAFPYSPGVVLGLSQHAVLPVLQVVSVCGIAGVSFLLAAFGVGLASRLRRSPTDGPRRTAAAVTGIVLVAAVAGGGALRLASATSAPGPAWPTIAAVDVNARRAAEGTVDRYLAASEGAVGAQPALLIWPESALVTDLERDHVAWTALTRFVADHGVPLLAGGPGSVLKAGRGMVSFNSAHLLVAGQGMQSYHKRLLMPVAEHWPAFLGSPPPDLTSLAAGDDAVIFALGDTAFGVLICFEITDAASARDLTRRGARFLVNITNDAWFADALAVPHLPWAPVRAVETGVSVVRAANAGTSAIFDRFGRELATSRPVDGARLLAARVPAGTPTLYARVGDAFTAVCLAAVLTAIVRLRRPRPAASTGGCTPRRRHRRRPR